MVFGTFEKPDKHSGYELRYFALAPGRMRSDQGVVIEVGDGLEALGKADIIIIPAWSDPEVAAPAELSTALRKAHKKSTLVIVLCLGAFDLCDAGFIDVKDATHHSAAT